MNQYKIINTKKVLFIMNYIDSLDEYVNRIDEKHKVKLSKRTANAVANMLGNSEKSGREIFNAINQNIEALEQFIDDFNKKHKTRIKKNPLEVKIDKAKLDLNFLISLTKIKRTAFITDVIVSNILNYKILIRPIKNAKIIATAYRYYLAFVRHALQSALIMIELSSDLFFTQINANLAGRKKEMKKMMETLTKSIKDTIVDSFMTGEFVDEKTGKKVSIGGIINSKKKSNEITQILKTMNSANRNWNELDRSYGYNQNVFQDFGRNIESQIKTLQDKEIQSLSEQFNTIANAATGFSKDGQAGAKEHVSNYATSVKLSTERRAMEVTTQIYMNMFEIIKMFSLRNIDNFSEYFEEADNIEKLEDECNQKIEKVEKEKIEAVKKVIDEYTKKINNTEYTEDEKTEILEGWKKKGIDTLCTSMEFKKIVETNGNAVNDILRRNGFNDRQIYDITQGSDCVQDYGKIYYEDLREWIKHEDEEDVKKSELKDDKTKNDDDLVCWLRKKSNRYRKIKYDE